MNLFGDLGLTDRERTVFLRGGDSTHEDDVPRRPSMEYDRAVREVRDFPEMSDEYNKAVEEVRAFPEFREI